MITTLALLVSLAAADPPAVELGIDVLMKGVGVPPEAGAAFAGKRLGLITNPSGVDSNLIPTADRLAADPRFELVRLFGPEHGIRGDVYAGDAVASSVDVKTGLPVESLYGATKRPSKEGLAAIDTLVFDVQDVGSRTYTFISTLGEAMIACAEAKKPLVVLDRPNPLGGTRFEGPLVRSEWTSFIGWSQIPITHGMTVGEIARYYRAELRIDCELIVVAMRGWRRDMIWEDTGLAWTQTSPHIPHVASAHAYVATGMIGGVTDDVNEGVGYTLPFETLAAEYVDEHAFAARLASLDLPGVRFQPIVYKPFYQRHAGKVMRGVRLRIVEPRIHRPVRTALALMTTLEAMYPKRVRYQEGRPFNIHWGDPEVLARIRRGESFLTIEKAYAAELERFAKARARHLLY
jgi:uncharacterized protein YbbC (DUF1343 family)